MSQPLTVLGLGLGTMIFKPHFMCAYVPLHVCVSVCVLCVYVVGTGSKQLTLRTASPPLHIGQGASAGLESCGEHPHVPSVAYTHHVAAV